MGLLDRMRKSLGGGEVVREAISDGAFPGLMVTTGRPYVVEGPSCGRIELWEGERTVKVGSSEGTLQPPKGFGRVVYEIEWETSVRPEIAGLGHALASRYGAGAPGMLIRALLGIGSGF